MDNDSCSENVDDFNGGSNLRRHKLTTCPYCDSYDKGTVVKTSTPNPYNDYNIDGYYVVCTQCSARGPLSNLSESAAEWNRIATVIDNHTR